MELFKKPFNLSKNIQIFAFLFILSLFFPIRHVFFNDFALIKGVYSDFTSFSLYLSDIFLFVLFLLVYISQKDLILNSILPLKWLFFWVFLLFVIAFNQHYPQNIYYLAKLLELFVAYGTFSIIFQKNDLKISFSKLFVILSAFQSSIALLQFKLQHPVGLFKLGEQQIYPNLAGIAKIVQNNQVFVRGYGTFFHPNPLSAFLIVGILLNIYLLQKSVNNKTKAFRALMLVVNILGLTVTFSRGAYFAMAIGLLIYFGVQIIKNSDLKSLKLPFFITILGIIISLLCFKGFLFSRASNWTDSASDRALLNKIGQNILKQHPVFGLGLGESIRSMEYYSKVELKPWQIQPVHNYFLLSAVELGIPGALLLIWLFLNHLWQLIKRGLTTYNLLLTTILSVFLVLMLFDHYFYTLQQTQMLLWIILGIISAQLKTPQEGESGKFI